MPYTDHTNPDTAAAFDKVAPTYDAMFSGPFRRAEESVIFDRFAHLFQLADVLDIGCGTGRVKRLTDKLLFKPRSYTGVDMSFGMLMAAMENHKDAQFISQDHAVPKPPVKPDVNGYRPKFIHAEMLNFMLSQPAESYDVVSAMNFPANYCITPPFELCQAVHHVLRPGGHFINIMATSRYAARPDAPVPASNMRRFFFFRKPDLNVFTWRFELVAVEGYNYYAEKYRRWLNLCPQAINRMMFRLDQSAGQENNKLPYIYAIHLTKE
jgi:SAM-dependent methyltransferase